MLPEKACRYDESGNPICPALLFPSLRGKSLTSAVTPDAIATVVLRVRPACCSPTFSLAVRPGETSTHSKAMPKNLLSRTVVLIAAIAIGFSTATAAFAGSATWNANPANGYWGFADNWTPATVPDAAEDTATFDKSSITSLDQMSMSVGSIVFNPGAKRLHFHPVQPRNWDNGWRGNNQQFWRDAIH